MDETSGAGTAFAAAPLLPLYTVFGMQESSTTYWAVVLTVAFVVVAAVLLNQIAARTLILKE
jgi:hypothetical protein